MTMDLSSVLAFAPRHTRLEVRRITEPTLRAYCSRAGLREGDTFSCSRADTLQLLLVTERGRRVLLDIEQAMDVVVGPGLLS